MPKKPQKTKINTLNEKPLHADLKKWYAQPGDRLEVPVDGHLIDIVRGDLLVEIQTRNFSAIRRKLRKLAQSHPVRLVYPVTAEKWIVRLDDDGQQLGRRKSPKRGRVEEIFGELVYLPALLSHPNFTLEALLIQEEEIRRKGEGHHGWRRHGWVTHERRLIGVVEQRLFGTPADLLALIPADVEEPFTTGDLAAAMDMPQWLARKMCYCLRAMDAIERTGKRVNALLYRRTG